MAPLLSDLCFKLSLRRRFCCAGGVAIIFLGWEGAISFHRQISTSYLDQFDDVRSVHPRTQLELTEHVK